VAGFIAAQRDAHQIPHATACRALGVSPAWFYKWRDGDASRRRARRAQLTVEIRRLFASHRGRYGSPRITADLHDAGWRVSTNTVAKIMAEQQLVARRRRRRGGTRPGRGRWRAPDLVGRRFAATQVNRKWYGDGTEILTNEGKLYLDSVLDMASRRIVGFALGGHHDAALAYAALAMAVAVRGGRDAIAGVILYTDQGSEYTAKLVRGACDRLGIGQSMGRPGSVRHQGRGPREGRCLDRGVQPRPAPLGPGHATAGDLRAAPRRLRGPTRRCSMITRFRLPSVVPSSPRSRPSPAGGLRPAVTPAAGDTLPTAAGTGPEERAPDQDPPT